MTTYLSDNKLASLANPATLSYVSSITGDPGLDVLAKHVNLTKVFATIDRTKVVESTNPERRRDNGIYLNSWTYTGGYYEAVREAVDWLQTNTDSTGVYSVHINGELVGSETLDYRVDLTRNILFDQVTRLVDVAIKYSGLV